ncbi:MAG: hypothetical protein KKB30_07160 [Proteobacteria bacterium]|nr:hypothetical protein [Pseudomonadota bacterium]MBU1714209.1 hypothetical protein [Pseudomonadota bacterium]
MSVLNQESIFTSMLQDGPFAVGDQPPTNRPFSKATKLWVREITANPLLKTKYRIVRNQIFDFLGTSCFDEVFQLIHRPEAKKACSTRAQKLIGNMFGIDGSDEEISRYLKEYARTADDVINSMRTKILAPYVSHIEMTNEIEATSDPVELLLIIFNDRFHKKARFEAKRKLQLISLAGSIDQRKRESHIVAKFSGFLDFLNDYVWSPSLKIGDLQISYLLSRHDAKDFKCVSVKTISRETAESLVPAPGEKLTLIKRRSFRDKKVEIPIYVSIRKKEPAAKVLKLLRKNQKDPAVAVDDELGLMAVLNSIGDVKKFMKHLTNSAVRANSFMTLEDISDTLTEGKYSSKATGSSTKTQMLKFFARLGGMRVEFIIHTNRSYLNYIYQRDVSHAEYEIKRIFDTGVAEFLFPKDIYHLNMDEIKQRQIKWCRKRIEEY